MSRLRWLLVGTGDIARKRVAAALCQARGSELAAVCDLDPERAGSLAAEYGGVPVFTDLDQALKGSDTEAVYVATPVALHVPQTLQALEAGRHVLVEKPLGLDAAECRAVVEAAARTGRRAGCAYFRRLFPAFDQAWELLAAGTLGRVVLVRMAYYSWFAPEVDDPKRWRVVRTASGGGPLSDMGSHMLDLLVGLLGMPETVFARCASLVHPWEVEDTASIVMTLPGGAQVSAQFGWSSKAWRHELEIVGTEGKLYWYPFDSGKVVQTIGRQVEELELPPVANVHLPLVQDFVDAVAEGRDPVCPLAEAARTNALLDAVYRSASEHREVAP